MKADRLAPLPRLVASADAQPPVRGARLLRGLDRLLLRLTQGLRAALPDSLNPLLQLGAIANIALIAAIVSGVLLLIWYTPSHTGAWASVEAMHEAPLTAGLMRSLHRYASDATLLFSLLHGLQTLASRRLAGPRWVAWVTGMLAVGLIWIIGWLGYWLVWDQRAQLVAVGTAQALDVLPIFTDPLSRSFITNESVSSLLFFVVFFVHMLLPLIIGILLWLHLSRLARPRFLTRWPLTAWVIGTLIALSLLLPAQSAPAADMSAIPDTLTMDWWYLLPVALTDRLSGGLLWLVTFVLGVIALGAPWYLVAKRRPVAASDSNGRPRGPALHTSTDPGRPQGPPLPAPAAPPTRRALAAEVDPAKCNACQKCFHDCPYDAISMVARSDGKNFPSVALVDPARCIGCGICAGSCDSSGIGLDWLPVPAERRKIDQWLASLTPDDPDRMVAFACARSAAETLPLDPDGRSSALPGYRVCAVPCAGWVHPLSVERALRRGAAGVLIVACRPGSCTYREGATWTAERLAGRREPVLRKDHVDPSRVLLLEHDAHERAALLSAAAAFRARANPPPPAPPPPSPPGSPRRPRARAILVGLVSAAAFAALTWLPSDLPYQTPTDPDPQLVVSFKIAGEVTERCRTRTPEELAALPAHKRTPQVCERGRAPVHLRVALGDRVLLDRDYAPSGAFGDGASVAVETLTVPPGRHPVTISIGSPPAALTAERELDFRLHSRRVVLFDRLTGFSWH